LSSIFIMRDTFVPVSVGTNRCPEETGPTHILYKDEKRTFPQGEIIAKS
jgi:hypothetical protein